MRFLAVGRRATALAGAAAILGTAACGTILGLGDYTDAPAGAGGSGASGGGTTTTSTTTGSGATGGGGSTSTSTGGGGAEPTCGNGKLDGDETCDGDCPAECIDPELCTSEAMTGSPGTCDVVCPFAPIAACKNDDGCCPSGCFPGNDSDCQPKVIVVSWDAALVSVKNALVATGKFGVVDTFNAQNATPTLADLQGHAAALVYANVGWTDPIALGDVLADYFDAGGRVVMANGADCADSFRVRGRFETDGYHLLQEGGVNPNPDDSTAVETQSPLLVGAETFTAAIHCVGAPVAGAVVVAHYAGGDASVVRGKVGARNRVDVNVYPGLDWQKPAVVTLMTNALLYPSKP